MVPEPEPEDAQYQAELHAASAPSSKTASSDELPPLPKSEKKKAQKVALKKQ